MDFTLQPTLENDRVLLMPLKESDFDVLYKAASDPEVWAQHPNPDRWKKDVFTTFFEGALQSHGAFRILDKETGATVGSTRYYDFDLEDDSVFIGYTFLARSHWGNGFNATVKHLMLHHAFKTVSKVKFHIGANNIRSQIAITRLGAQKIGEQEVPYYGEPSKLNFVYEISRNVFMPHFKQPDV